MKLTVIALAATIALAGLAAPVSAHHAINAQFDVTKSVTKKGVLTKLDNINPHAYWHFEVVGPNGRKQAWAIESVAPAALRRAGIRVKDTIKIGDTYEFQIAPARNGGTTGLLLALVVEGKSIRFTGEG